VFACTSLGEECVKGIIATANRLVAWHLAVRLNTMLEAEELPTRISDLNACLADVDADGLTHGCKVGETKEFEMLAA